MPTNPQQAPQVDNEYFLKTQDFILRFSGILWEAMPFIILGAIIAGILEEFLPPSLVARILPRSRFLSIAAGGLLGLLFPMCECGIIPVMRRLLRKGLPLSCCVSYLLAGPIINFIVILSTFTAFAGQESHRIQDLKFHPMGSLWMTGLRIGLGYVVAVVTGLVVDWQSRKHGASLLTPLTQPTMRTKEEDAPGRKPSWDKRLANISETALIDFVDITAFLIIGALLAAFVRVWATQEKMAQLAEQHIVLSILLMMFLAIILCLCSEADAFFAATFVALPPATKLAFLVLGPMMDLKLYMLYTRVFRPRLIWTIFGTVLVQVFVYSLVVHYLWERYGPSVTGP